MSVFGYKALPMPLLINVVVRTKVRSPSFRPRVRRYAPLLGVIRRSVRYPPNNIQYCGGHGVRNRGSAGYSSPMHPSRAGETKAAEGMEHPKHHKKLQQRHPLSMHYVSPLFPGFDGALRSRIDSCGSRGAACSVWTGACLSVAAGGPWPRFRNANTRYRYAASHSSGEIVPDSGSRTCIR